MKDQPTQPRAGAPYRSNINRYFHVMSQGWYVYTREGIRGPFLDKGDVESFVTQLNQGGTTVDDPSQTWRL